ncbi:MAG: thiamine phosphate synthase, partial [bacterium]
MNQTFPFKLYLIGDRHQSLGRPLTQVLREAGEAGVAAFQFREKDLSLRAQFELASEIRAL